MNHRDRQQLVVKTRILPPRRQMNILRRRRLLDILERLVAHRLTLVVAPAGYGKTSLLVDLADDISDAVCWYTIDILDQDPYRFIAHWIAAISHRFPQFGLQSNTMLRTFSLGQASLDQLLITIVNELFDTVEEDFVFIVDDYHLVDGVSDIGYFLTHFIQNIGPNCHVLLASRKLLALPDLALLVARSQVAGIDYADLVFTQDEFKDIVQRRFGYHISAVDAAALIDATEGWITGLLLAAHDPTPERILPGRLTHAVGVDLYDYLAQQVLNQQPDYLRHFLLRTAALEEFDVELCETIFDVDWLPPEKTWRDLIDAVLSRGLFVLPVGKDGAWLRFHRLFQEFLLHNLHQEFPDDECTILSRLAKWNQDQQRWERAYHLYQRLQDARAVVRLVIESGPPLLRDGRAQLVDKWTAALPARTLRDKPELQAIRGVALVQIGHVTDGLAALNQSVDGLRDAPLLTRTRTLAWRAVVYRLMGDYGGSIVESKGVLALVANEGDVEPEQLIICALCQKNIGLSYFMQGGLKRAVSSLEDALRLYEDADDEIGMATIRMDMGTANMNMGRLADSLRDSELAADTWRRFGHLQQLALASNNLGVLFRLRGELVLSLKTLSEALQHSMHTGFRRIEALAYASLGDLLVDLEYWEGARVAYSRCHTIATDLHSRFLELYANLQRSKLASLNNESVRAKHYLNEADKYRRSDRSDYEQALYQLTVGIHYMMDGQPSETIGLFTEAYQRFNDGRQVVEALTAQIWLAAVYQMLGNEEQAHAAFSTALVELFDLESQYSVAVAARPVATLLGTIEMEPGNEDLKQRFMVLVLHWHTRLLTLRRQARQIDIPVVSELLTVGPTVTIQALGRTELKLHGEVVSNSQWKTLVSRDILYCLIAHPKGLSRAEIGVIFWPDSSPGQLKTRFKNAIYRLRGALMADIVVYDNDIYRFNRNLDYEYDVEIFLDAIESTAQAVNADDKLAALERVLDVYGGLYCSDIEYDWAWIEREKLERAYRRALLELGRIHFDNESLQQAMDLCQGMLARDSCWEDAHRLAMRIHAAMGNRAAIARQFIQCQQALHDEVDANPSQQTEQLFTKLMAQSGLT